MKVDGPKLGTKPDQSCSATHEVWNINKNPIINNNSKQQTKSEVVKFTKSN